MNVISPVFASFLRNLQSGVTGVCEETESLKRRSLLLWRWRKFTGYSLIHSPLIYHTLTRFQEGIALGRSAQHDARIREPAKAGSPLSRNIWLGVS